MSLIEQIEHDLKDAMRAREATRVGTLRLVLSSLRSAEKDAQRALLAEEELKVLERERNRRLEAAEAFRGAGRAEQAAGEEAELAIVLGYLPEPLSEAEIERIVDRAIAETGATSMRDMGKIMHWIRPEIAGRADGSAVSQLVREKLA